VQSIFCFSWQVLADETDEESNSENTDEESMSGQTEDEFTECIFISNIMANLTACCVYPRFVMWRWQYDECGKKCGRGKTRVLFPAVALVFELFYLDFIESFLML
jgi:hypothetical protein